MNLFLGTTEQLIHTSQTLARLVVLNGRLPSGSQERQEKLKPLKSALDAIRQANSFSQESINIVREFILNPIVKSISKKSELPSFDGEVEEKEEMKPIDILDLYGLAQVPSDETITQMVYTLFKDVDSIAINPLRKSERGVNGLTFLVGYSRLNSKKSSNWLHTAIIKWTDKLEFPSTNLFRRISCALPEGSFVVPRAAMIDFEEKIHINGDGEILELSPEALLELRKQFNVIASSHSSPLRKKPTIMFSEKITGLNLADFIIGPYQDLLKEQKEALFRKLGSIAFLDIILGNTDRLVRTRPDFSGFDCEASSNMGNVMLTKPTSENPEFSLYAIDNGIYTNTEKNGLYLKWMGTILNMEEASIEDINANIANSVLSNISRAVESMIQVGSSGEMGSEETRKIRKSLQLCSGDLENFGFEGILEGVQSMHEMLKVVKLDELAGFSVEDSLFEVVKERIEVFKKQTGVNSEY